VTDFVLNAIDMHVSDEDGAGIFLFRGFSGIHLSGFSGLGLWKRGRSGTS
jgi:hypothetical protein